MKTQTPARSRSRTLACCIDLPAHLAWLKGKGTGLELVYCLRHLTIGVRRQANDERVL